MATDIGLKRTENQDRIAALRINSNIAGGHPFLAVAVADGMGGMRDGGRCATIAMSTFFWALNKYHDEATENRITSAISEANASVYDFAGGKGGTTLSALIIDQFLRTYIINVGDSRIYSYNDEGLNRLTVDDSLAEALGGHGRDLLQFVGMGDGMQPHLKSTPIAERYLALTTDGIHFIEPETFEQILSFAPDLKSASERLSALARWCGGHDNASLALMDLNLYRNQSDHRADGAVQVWDSLGSLSAFWIKEASSGGQDQVNEQPPAPQYTPKTFDIPKTNEASTVVDRPRKRTTQKKSGRGKIKNILPNDIQLEIKIEGSDTSGK